MPSPRDAHEPRPHPEVALIYACARNGVIGRDGGMPWHLPEDLAHFRTLTRGAPVVMGRKTWDSLPERFRPLPGRRNLVISRNAGWHAQGAEWAPSLEAALALCEGAPTVWVIGGAQIYAQALPLASRAEVTHIDVEVQGDAFAPRLDAQWTVSARQTQTSASGLALEFVTYLRSHTQGV